MKFDVEFKEISRTIHAEFGEIYNVSDGGYERGYADGLAARKYETWTITLSDGTVIDKKVALL